MAVAPLKMGPKNGSQSLPVQPRSGAPAGSGRGGKVRTAGVSHTCAPASEVKA
eukprot:CAMPEP_0172161734 /NCGR_PEP_ID=MMETSP1050-20130122/6285_1 /TAXON_ID=233186 /ORGANISM="Cryptomonas curvata, Strain CCAP979/52" /LENGTH=52 /DNA_ID=CAMNT_0012831655 /DNA_START=7 /DNA_END=162 /DNA_ORIENTATION=-